MRGKELESTDPPATILYIVVESIDPPAILPSDIVADERGKLYYDGHRVMYAWHSEKQGKAWFSIPPSTSVRQRLLANSEECVDVTQISNSPIECTWPDRHFVGYVYADKFP